MRPKWFGIIIAAVIVIAGAATVWVLVQRADGASVVAAEGESVNPVTVTAVLPPTITRKPQPVVIQSTRVAPQPSPTAVTVTKATPTESLLPTSTSTKEVATTVATVVATPTEEPQPSSTLPPTDTPPPPTLTPTPTVEAVGTDWLQYVNIFRDQANLPRLLENPVWSLQDLQHSRYMTYTGRLEHGEDSASQYYSQEGQVAAENGNIAAGWIGSLPFKWAINYWMSAPFHAIPIIDPQLSATGFAEYRDESGAQPLTATMDVKRGLGSLPEDVTFPIMYPRDGGTTWVLRYSLPEFPEALSTCPGYVQPTGAPIILQLGDGQEVPNVTATSLSRDGEYLAHCRFDETNFTHPNDWRQKSARLILDNRDAIVIIPQQPMLPDSTYSVRIDANGQTYTWSFHTLAGPP